MTVFDVYLLGALLALIAVLDLGKRKKILPLPPGPTRWPLIGNLLDIPTEFIWLTFDKWYKTFQSDIIYISVVGRDFLILNTYEAAVEVLEKRSAFYSSRPGLQMTNLMGCDRLLPLLPYGEEWRSQRRLFNQAFNVRAAKMFEPRQLGRSQTSSPSNRSSWRRSRTFKAVCT